MRGFLLYFFTMDVKLGENSIPNGTVQFMWLLLAKMPKIFFSLEKKEDILCSINKMKLLSDFHD